MCIRSTKGLLGALLITPCVAGCSAGVDGVVRNAAIPALEIVIADDGDKEKASRARKEQFYSLGYSQVEGDFQQSLADWDEFYIGGKTFTGPLELENQAALKILHVRYNRLNRMKRLFEWRWGVGLSAWQMNLTSRSGALEGRMEEAAIGPHASVSIGGNFNSKFGYEAAISGFGWLFLPDFGGFTMEQKAQLYYRPFDSMKLFLGVREQSYTLPENYDSKHASSIHVKFSGPTAGIELRF